MEFRKNFISFPSESRDLVIVSSAALSRGSDCLSFRLRHYEEEKINFMAEISVVRLKFNEYEEQKK